MSRRTRRSTGRRVIKDQLATEKPNAIVVMLGLNDRIAIRERVGRPKPCAAEGGESKTARQDGKAGAARHCCSRSRNTERAADNTAQHPVPGGSYEFHTDQWAELYVKRIDEMIAALKSKGVPVLWVGLPAIRGPKSTSDMSYLDELYRERAERAGDLLTSTSGTASSTTRAATRCRVRISKARSGGCAPATASISPKPAR